MLDSLAIVGYSGHAFVIIEAAQYLNIPLLGYYEKEKMSYDPYMLEYLGNEKDQNFQIRKFCKIIIGIGDNCIRKNIAEYLGDEVEHQSLIHPKACLSPTAQLGEGTFVSANACVNAFARIGKHGIINTGSIVEHECVLGDYVHVAPGAVLAGNVKVGSGTFIGANSTVKQGVIIGDNVIIGAGSVVIRDIPSAVTVVGNPSKIIR